MVPCTNSVCMNGKISTKKHSHLAPLAFCAGGGDVASLGHVSAVWLRIAGDGEGAVSRLEDLDCVKCAGSWG